MKCKEEALKQMEDLLKDYGLENREEDNFATSLDIARILNEVHGVILKYIRNTMSELAPESIEVGNLRFEESYHKDSNNREVPIIKMNKDAFMYIMPKLDGRLEELMSLAICG